MWALREQKNRQIHKFMCGPVWDLWVFIYGHSILSQNSFEI